jgi:hypothetical protein
VMGIEPTTPGATNLTETRGSTTDDDSKGNLLFLLLAIVGRSWVLLVGRGHSGGRRECLSNL